MAQESTPVWVRIQDGDVFDGSWKQFTENWFDTPDAAREMCAQNLWTLELFDFVPGVNGRPIPTTAHELGAALREYATRAQIAGVTTDVTDHLWAMADAVDGGRGPAAHHGCPDMGIPTAQCAECHLVLDVEVSSNAPFRDGTVFDGALEV